MKEVIIYKFIPSIIEVFPRDTITITIQLDGDSAHNVDDYMDVCRVITEINLPITLENNLLKVQI